MINKINIQNNCKNSISFGLNAANRNAIYQMHANPTDRVAIIKSFDMTDPDITPCFDEFEQTIVQNPSRSAEMIAILDKLSTYRGNNIKFRECLSYYIDYWSKFFLSTRIRASEFFDNIGIKHPPTGHLSRTATNPNLSSTALNNIEKANEFIKRNTKKDVCPDIDFMKNIHKIMTRNLKFRFEDSTYNDEQYSGIIEGSDEDTILLRGRERKCPERLDKFMAWLNRNYSKDDAFMLASQSYKKLLGICPFYDANGRTIRSFIDALLLSKGYRFKKYPANYAEVRSMNRFELRNLIKENCEKAANNQMLLNI